MSNTYQEFLEERHKKFVTPDKVISSIVKKAVNSDISGKKRLVKGENSEVYDVSTGKGSIILRISRSEHPSFETEEWAIRQCQALGLPVPKVLYVDQERVDGQSLSFSVETKLPGESLDDLLRHGKLSKGQLSGVLRQAGELLARIHTIKIEGFGGIDKEGKGEFRSFADYMKDKIKKAKRLFEVAEKIKVNPGDISEAIKIIDSHRDFYGSVKESVLLHNDYSPKHILVEGGRITGLIDFETVIAGSPLLEFTRWEYYFGEDYPLKLLLDGYSDKQIFDDKFGERISLFRLAFGLDIMNWYEVDNHELGLNHARIELKNDLEYFKNE